MDRRDAELQKVEIVEKQMFFAKDYVTCNNCGCNYSTEGKYPGQFCQVFTLGIDNSKIAENEERALKCEQWVPVGVNRNKIITPAYRTWYEKED